MTGATASVDFPTLNPYQASKISAQDGFVTKLNPTGESLVYSTYLGAQGTMFPKAIAVDASGSAYVTGSTLAADFPTLNAYQDCSVTGEDAFLTQFTTSGSGLLFSTCLSGINADRASGLAVDMVGNAYLAGTTFSGDFPNDGVIQSTFGGGSFDAFVAKFGSGYLNPTPYLSQADSPFFASIQAGTTYLETFEDGLFNTPGVTASAGSVSTFLHDSVDCDDGVIDGSGTNGQSFFSGDGPGGITFTFNATALGGFPTKAGIVWTDGGGGSSVTFEAFDNVGASLGVVGPVAIADGSNSGTTAEDRFFGAVNPSGISAIHISNSSGGIEVDHLQYGPFAGASPLSFSPGSADFGPIAVGNSSSGFNIVISNTGSSAVNIASISVTGDFSIIGPDTNCPVSGGALGADLTCNLDLRFTPTVGGLRQGIAQIVSDASGSPHVIPLTGTGLGAGAPDPVAFINQPLVPTSVAPGSGAFTLTVNGTGFTPNSIVHWNGNPRTTTFINSRQVTADILAADLTTATTAEVAVDNPAPGGSGSTRSNLVFFQVTNPTASVAMSKADYAVGSNPFSVATQDFNGDGMLDLAVANFGDGTVSILLGNGDGTFLPTVPPTFATGLQPLSVTTGEFNADGKLDLALSNFSGTISILLGIGDGTFQTQTTFATGSQPSSVTTADFNGDGRLDLAVANPQNSTISILLGNGDGTFQGTTFVTGRSLNSLTAGDFNADGKLDLAGPEYSSNNKVSILLGIGNGTFQANVDFATGTQPYAVTTADFNADDKLDLAVTNFSDGTVSILLGNGDGTFQTQTPFATGGRSVSVTAGDFNGDGQLDLAVANGSGNAVSILLGIGDGTFQPQTPFATGSTPLSVTTGDFNEDGRLDLAVSNFSSDTVSVLLQTIAVQLSPASLDFGNQLINTTSPVMQVILTNTGTATLNFACPGCGFNVQISTSNTTASPHFSANNTCGTSLGTGLSCTINAFFTPLVLGPLSAVIAINSDDPGSPHFVNLSGTGTTNAAITVGPAVNFPGNPLLVNCPTKPVTITNTGDVPLDIASIAATLPFSVASHNCPTTLAVDASCVAQVRFSPTVVGAAAGTLTVTTNPATTGNTVNLTGTGTPACQLLAAVRVVTVLRGTEAQEFGIEDAKPSCSPVELSLTCSVENPAACLLTPAVIAPSGASTLRVTNLKRVGAESLVVEVTSTSEFRQATERVSVRFADFAMTRSPEEAAVEAGGAASYALAVRPVNGLAGPVTFTCSGAPRGATCAVEPANITLDGASVAQVKVKVATSGGAALPMVNLPDDGARRAVPLLAVLLGLLMVGATRRVARGGRGSAPSGTGRGPASPLRLVLATMMLLMLLWASCGGGGVMNLAGGGTPAGRYALKVTGTYSSSSGPTPGTLSNSTTLNLKVN